MHIFSQVQSEEQLLSSGRRIVRGAPECIITESESVTVLTWIYLQLVSSMSASCKQTDEDETLVDVVLGHQDDIRLQRPHQDKQLLAAPTSTAASPSSGLFSSLSSE